MDRESEEKHSGEGASNGDQLPALHAAPCSGEWTVMYVVCPTKAAADAVDKAIRKCKEMDDAPWVDLQTSYLGYRDALDLPNM